MKYKILFGILFLFGVVCLFSMCNNGNRTIYNDNDTTHADYSINHYVDTIYGHIIVTTVCENTFGYISVSTVEFKD